MFSERHILNKWNVTCSTNHHKLISNHKRIFPMVTSLSLPPFFLPQTNHWLLFTDRWLFCSNQSLSHLHFCFDSKFRARFPIWDSQIAQKKGKCFAIYVCFVNESFNSYNFLEWKEILMIFHAIQTTENCFLAPFQGHYQT